MSSKGKLVEQVRTENLIRQKAREYRTVEFLKHQVHRKSETDGTGLKALST